MAGLLGCFSMIPMAWISMRINRPRLGKEKFNVLRCCSRNIWYLKAIFCISIASAPRIHLLFAGLTMIPWLVAFAVRCYSGCPPCRSAKDRVDPCNTKCSINPQEAGNLKQLFCEVLAHIQNCFYSVLRKLKLKITTFSCVDSNLSGFCLNSVEMHLK